MTHDDALQRFHEDMGNALDSADRALALSLLTKRTDETYATRIFEAWRLQDQRAKFELQRSYGR